MKPSQRGLMRKLHPILKTSKSPRPDFMRTVQSIRNVTVMINYVDGEHMTQRERVRVKGEGGRERERQYFALFNRLIQTLFA